MQWGGGRDEGGRVGGRGEGGRVGGGVKEAEWGVG